MRVRIIGDVHGKIREYSRLIADVPLSLQLGDMGFDYSPLRHWVDPKKHQFIPGNHDNYLLLDDLPHALSGGFGTDPLGIPDSFWIRGAYSIDYIRRTPGKDLFFQEELNLEQQYACEEAYLEAKPRVVFSHDAPHFLVPYVGNLAPQPPSNTQVFLQHLWESHQPELWMFGHYHNTRLIQTPSTIFRCLDELHYEDMEF